MDSTDLLAGLLKDVSRSFYLTLRVLPAPVRRQIGLAYLLARASDTIADTTLVALDRRLAVLESFRERIIGRSATPLRVGELSGRQSSDSERKLLLRIEEALGLLNTLSEGDRKLVQQVLETILGGQELDLRRFEGAKEIRSLQTGEELDDYTYRVAGCVGEFWTRMCRAHLFADLKVDHDQWLADGVRFGKGLQLVNILRDLPADLRNGRCYLPAEELAQADLKPSDLLESASFGKLRPVYERWLDRAEGHLDAGWRYTLTIPRAHLRLRLACAWPVLIGARTLAMLRRTNPLRAEERVKVSRAEVRNIILGTLVFYPFAGRWDGLLERTRRMPLKSGCLPTKD